ncbi:MAG: LysM peptidoglycan-binding domain-containing protein [Burkholderiaceae bacterium]|nr:LysM peptidoglycan-binding domain-containing protein [Burkholderiaceae bacterium]
MKKFSIAASLLVSTFIPALALLSQASLADTISQEMKADPNAFHCEFLENAPDQHVVVVGDTLWSISGQFLKHPWCWPQVWGINKDQISNPHWIYPGQIVYFDRAAGRLRLGTPIGGTPAPNYGGGKASGDLRLEPQTRTQNLASNAITSIANSVIEPFLSQPLVVGEKELNEAPRIVATQEGRVVVGKGDRAYVRGDLKGGTSFQVFRPAKPLKDPGTGKVIGYEAVYLGTIKLVRAAADPIEAHTFSVANAKEEMGIGDRLLPSPPTPLINYMPHAPLQPMAARIVSIYEGVSHAGQNQIVSINRGRSDGVDVGTVLQLFRFGTVVADPTDHNKAIKLPDEEYGDLFVFRVFDNISYALIMDVRDSAQVGDLAKSPE